MSKAVLISIQPQWCKKIMAGEKTIEVRKTKPNLQTPFKCYVYCTQGYGKNTFNVPILDEAVRKHYEETGSMEMLNCPIGNGKVIGEFVCDKVDDIHVFDNGTIQNWNAYGLDRGCVNYDDMAKYIGTGKTGYGWHISDFILYEQPKDLSEFEKYSEDDLRPCQNGKKCEHQYFDVEENCKACSIDFDGENCPVLKISRPPQSWCYVEEVQA